MAILIIDDDDQLRSSFEKLLMQERYEVETAASGEDGIALLRNIQPELVILDMRLPGMNGFETFERIHETEPRLPVIIMTAYGTTETAIKATKMGAFDYILKPFEIPDMLSVIEKALQAGRFMRRPVDLDAVPHESARDAIVGRSRPMQEVYKSIGRVASTDATVLIRGESGTGKELVARAIYQHSERSSRPFLVINCVAIPETLLESELFGYEKGAFTGAVHRRIGKIEQAHKGTVFLDEIGDMPFSLQSKMLRLLQEKSIERLGGRETIPVDVRIIAATNRNLEEAIQEGRFREDLYYRLAVVTIALPELTRRYGDIPYLAEYFLSRFSCEEGMENPGIDKDAIRMLESHTWPGNIRELSNVLKKALIFNQGGPVSREIIRQAVGGDKEVFVRRDPSSHEDSIREWIRDMLKKEKPENLFENLTDRFAAIVIREALRMCEGNRSQAAKLLGLSRPTLHAKIDKYNLRFHTFVEEKNNTMGSFDPKG